MKQISGLFSAHRRTRTRRNQSWAKGKMSIASFTAVKRRTHEILYHITCVCSVSQLRMLFFPFISSRLVTDAKWKASCSWNRFAVRDEAELFRDQLCLAELWDDWRFDNFNSTRNSNLQTSSHMFRISSCTVPGRVSLFTLLREEWVSSVFSKFNVS